MSRLHLPPRVRATGRAVSSALTVELLAASEVRAFSVLRSYRELATATPINDELPDDRRAPLWKQLGGEDGAALGDGWSAAPIEEASTPKNPPW